MARRAVACEHDDRVALGGERRREGLSEESCTASDRNQHPGIVRRSGGRPGLTGSAVWVLLGINN